MKLLISKYEFKKICQLFDINATHILSYLAGQLLRSGTSPALNYGEAQIGESRNDFIHKIKIVLKELRETLVCLKIIYRVKLFTSEAKIQAILKETDELVAIFVKSTMTSIENNWK